MNYRKIYDNLINTRKERKLCKSVYVEKHHVIPKVMGGDNNPNNLIELTAREHFLAHWLLYKIHKSSQMAMAYFSMTRKGKGQDRRITSRQYQSAKVAMSKSKKGEGNFWYGTTGPMGGKTHTDDFKKKHKIIMREASKHKKGREASNIPGFDQGKGKEHQFKTGYIPWNKGKIGKESHIYGTKRSEETKAKLRKPKRKVSCPHCNKIGGISQMKRWHYENCKYK